MFEIVPKPKPKTEMLITASMAVLLIEALTLPYKEVGLDAEELFSIQEMRELISQVYSGASELELKWAKRNLELVARSTEVMSMVPKSTALKYQRRMTTLVARHVARKKKNEKN